MADSLKMSKVHKAIFLAIEKTIKICDEHEGEGIPLEQRKVDYTAIVGESIKEAMAAPDWSDPHDGIKTPVGFA